MKNSKIYFSFSEFKNKNLDRKFTQKELFFFAKCAPYTPKDQQKKGVKNDKQRKI